MLVFIVGISYIVQINRLATMGYEIKEREKEIKSLHRENETLKIQATELKSMHNLELEKEEMKLRKPQEVSYIEIEEPVALGR